MDIVISHVQTKRRIRGDFELFLHRKDAESLRDQLDTALEEPWIIGWVLVKARDEEAAPGQPKNWDDDGAAGWPPSGLEKKQ